MADIEVRNPYTGKSIQQFQLENLDQVTIKFDRAQKTQQKWKQEPLSKRLAMVRTGLDYFSNNSDQIAHEISLQMGRPCNSSSGELKGFFERANHMCEIAEKSLAADIIEDSDQFFRSIEHVPLGVLFVISAWNYPLLITVNSVIPALLSGNTILLKHSSQTPLIGKHFENAFNKMGSHDGLLQQVIVSHETTGKIIEDLPIDHVIFTGSVKGGRQILKHTSKKFISPQLELGGKDASYVAADADLELAADCIVDGAMFNSGQSCCGIERVYASKEIHDAFVKACEKRIATYKLGDPLDRSTSMGPVAMPKSVDFMLTQITEAKEKGAQVICGGSDFLIKDARFMQPTLLTETDHFMDVMREENFGPILPIMKVDSLDEAVSLVNDCDYGLTASVFTSSDDTAREFANGVDVGTVFMNRCDYLDPALPWTGYKDSGCGSALSQYGFMSVTKLKARHFKKQV